MAKQAVMKSGNYAFVGRKQKKRDFRSLWITRINNAVRAQGMKLHLHGNGLKKSGIELNRKMLSEMAIHDPKSFAALGRDRQERLIKTPDRDACAYTRASFFVSGHFCGQGNKATGQRPRAAETCGRRCPHPACGPPSPQGEKA